MKVQLWFTAQGQQAINEFENDELIESFSRHMKTLTKKYMVLTSVPLDENQDIASAGVLNVILEKKSTEVDMFFRELGRDMKNPLNKRFDGKLGNIFKTKMVIENRSN
ncbi:MULTISPECIES: hypothetical protein [unclassified Paenibacillus]|uniref:hypothetical protein n=1 Tax=unclassified Paenibacillus TaxID=185978 RepID=UPI001AE95921|nr:MULTISPECIES: hypothetical protein [unclassified Paenibacillus]MBP1156489.1 hypothetical protein [Paenibacillus sp. PvP091]MBP1168125.1 hypothetical protein [Paenibacillus sp. PvR098]MBP2439153.1 hypothetical protein [Paenibacillus sp. PvP052]